MIVPGQWTMTRDGPRRIEDCDPERILSLEPSQPVRAHRGKLTEYVIVHALGYSVMVHPQACVCRDDGQWVAAGDLVPGQRIKLAYPWQRDWQGDGDQDFGESFGEVFVDLAIRGGNYATDTRVRAAWNGQFTLDMLEQASSAFYRAFLRVVLEGGSAQVLHGPQPYVACIVPYGTERAIMRMFLRVGVPMTEQIGVLVCRGEGPLAAYQAFLHGEQESPFDVFVRVTHVDWCDYAEPLVGLFPQGGVLDVNGIAVR